MIASLSAKRVVDGAPVDIIDLDAYSIEEFCKRHSISRGTFYNMRSTDSGPREMRAMGRVLITKEAAEEWRTRQ